MLILSTDTVVKLNSPEVTTFFCYEVCYATGEYLYLTNWGEDVVWLGRTYESVVIQHSDMRQSSDGKINDVNLTIGNVDRQIQYFIENYDMIGKSVSIIQFFEGESDYIKMTFQIKGCVANKQHATFTLSIGVDFLTIQIPGRIIRGRWCRWRYGDEQCTLTNMNNRCDQSWQSCRDRNNTANFGGFPGISNDRLYF